METLFRILATKRVTFGIVCTLAEKLADILFGTLANTLAGVLCWIQLTTGTLKSTFATQENSGGPRPPSFSLLWRAGGALQALLGTSGPILSSSIQKYTYNICRSK